MNDTSYLVRMPSEVKEKLRVAAAVSGESMQSYALKIISDSCDKTIKAFKK